MTNMCPVITRINVQLRKSMFCDNADDQGKAWGDHSGISLGI